MMRWLLPCLLFLAGCASGGATETAEEPGLTPVTVVTASGEHEYMVELAITSEEQAQGLMYRQEMAADRGMLFPYDPPRPASFWMKNTYIPLDIIFIRPDGRIESIAYSTVPLSTMSYRSQGPVGAILELNAGEAGRIGAKTGDEVRYTLP
ncbi:MAG: DUF192 domain-containing protein [Pacificimonas sp.]|jgi:uncharacterized membrane protein (UPF0127 family)|nr:DUF192 domain-containing protein [Pacificimonas sp.]